MLQSVPLSSAIVKCNSFLFEDPGGGGRVLGLIFFCVCAVGLSEPLPSLFLAKHRPPSQSLWKNVIFAISTQRLNLFMHLAYKVFFNKQVTRKGIDTLVKRNEVKIFPFLNPYLPEFSAPLNSENVRSHYSNSTPSSTTSPLAYFQEVTPPLRLKINYLSLSFKLSTIVL